MSLKASSSSFQKIYHALNPAQKQAVDWIEGPVMVMAGPGTGKTQVLAARIANILLKTDTDPRSILALTFTDSAAKNMRERLVKIIGKAAYYVQINTFHAFCVEVIKTYPEYFPIERNTEPLTELERYDLFEKIIDQQALDLLRPLNAPYFYLKEMIKAISDLKKEGINHQDFKEILEGESQKYRQLKKAFAQQQKSQQRSRAVDHQLVSKTELLTAEKNLKKNQELLLIYQAYEQELRQNLRYDFDDMIALVLTSFEKNDLLLRQYQENFHYFLVDEFQDSNSAQNQVVQLLAAYWGEQANFFVVGDPNQSIYRFQGASLENMVAFIQRFPQAKVIFLKLVYRCPQLICDAAANLIRENHFNIESIVVKQDKILLKQLTLVSEQGKGSKIQVYSAANQLLENIFIAEKIKELLKQGVAPAEIAILYRQNNDAVDLLATLKKWQLPFQVERGENILTDEMIQQFVNLLWVVYELRNKQEGNKLFTLMQYPWTGLEPLMSFKLARLAAEKKLSLIDLLEDLIQPAQSQEKNFHQQASMKPAKKTVDTAILSLTTSQIKQLQQFIEKLYYFSSRDLQVTFTQFIEEILKESGFLPWLLLQADHLVSLQKLNQLFSQIKSLTSRQKNFKLADFLQTIQTMEEHDLKIQNESVMSQPAAVHLSTIHKAKGREWEHVFLIQVVDGKWGNNKKRELIKLPAGILSHTNLDLKERNEDERRLFYVALTRAKKQIYISYPQQLITDQRAREMTASVFIFELANQYINKEEIKIEEEATALEKLLNPAPTRQFKNQEKAFFQEIIKNFKLSVTSLNTYLRDPKEFIENVLLKVPRAKPIPMAFGTAVHHALEVMYRPLLIKDSLVQPLTPTLASLASVLAAFEQALRQELLMEEELKKRLIYGRDVLKYYYQQAKQTPVQPLMVERFFGTGFSRTVLDDIPLTGRIDRVDWLDKNKKTVTLIDYKTGRPKSVAEIEGQTQTAKLSDREKSLPASIRGSYKRQLLFYKLLTELDRSFIPTAEVGIFDFVEKNKQNHKIVKREFQLSQSAVTDLKKLIKEIMQEIRELKFL